MEAPAGQSNVDENESFAARFAGLCDWISERLTGGIVNPTLVGFALLNLPTYTLDLSLLATFNKVLNLHYTVSVGIAYAFAFAVAFVLNRWLNFHADGHVGAEGTRYAVTAFVNFTVFILGLSSLLNSFGVGGILARMMAGVCEAAFMYLMMRFFVFRETDRPGSEPSLDDGGKGERE